MKDYRGNNWKLSVKEYGKIESAEIEIKPMTVFVGSNSSGKSYLLTLMYGLLTLPAVLLFKGIDFDSKLAHEVKRIIASLGNDIYQFDNEELELMNRLLNQQLHINKKDIIKYLLNEEIMIEDISVTIDKEAFFSVKKEYDTDDVCKVFPVWSDGACKSGYTYVEEETDNKTVEHVIWAIMQYLLRKSYNEEGREDAVVYLPAARTGLMLAYKDLAGKALNDKYGDEEPYMHRSRLTRPIIDFVNKVAGISTDYVNNETKSAVKFIEDKIIGGRLVPQKTPLVGVEYLPFDCDRVIPLYLSSSLITELSSLVLFLSYSYLKLIFFEEPETALHPKLQKELGRVLIRLVNIGIPIFVSTHSDIIVQHLNNMLKIAKETNKYEVASKLEYDIDDIISENKIGIYQFQVDVRGRSTVEQLSCGQYGFEINSFYDTFISMSREVDFIEGD